MRAITLIMLLMTLGLSSANAVSIVGWERPISQSTMFVSAATGDFMKITTARVVLTRGDHSPELTGMKVWLDSYYEIFFRFLEVEGVEGVEEAFCGVQRLVAEYVSIDGQTIDMDAMDADAVGMQMLFINHSQCGEGLPYDWEVQMIGSSIISGELVLTGQSQPVYTIQKERGPAM